MSTIVRVNILTANIMGMETRIHDPTTNDMDTDMKSRMHIPIMNTTGADTGTGMITITLRMASTITS